MYIETSILIDESIYVLLDPTNQYMNGLSNV